MPFLDTRTIMLLMALTAIPTAALLLAVARYYAASVKGVYQWTGANLALAAGLILLGTSSLGRDFPAFVIGNTLLVLTASLYYLAIQYLLGDRPRFLLIGLTVAVSGAIFAYLWQVGAPYLLAVITFSIALMVPTGLSAKRLLLPLGTPKTVSQRFTGLLFLAAFLVMVGRLVHNLGSPAPPASLYDQNFWHGWTLGGIHIITLLSSLGFALMIVDQLTFELNRLATHDPLTGIGNRRIFYKRADIELARCRRKAAALSIVMIDLDYFKRVNDALGHAVGDETLRRFTQIITAQLREYDFFARLGGEEFAILLPDTSESAAVAIAERLRGLVATEHLPAIDFNRPITISLGVAETHDSSEALDRLIHLADRALYAAKGSGRNRVVAASWLADETIDPLHAITPLQTALKR